MKKLFLTLLTLSLAATAAIPALAAEPAVIAPVPAVISEVPASGYTVQVDDEDIGVQAQVMVPLRKVAEALGFRVTWNNGTVLVDDGTAHTEVVIGRDQYVIATSVEGMVGMSAPFSLGAIPYVTNGVTYVSLGLFDALMGREGAVTVDGSTIRIQKSVPGVQIPNPFADCETLEEAAGIAGFPFAVPEMAAGTRSVQTVRGEMIQVIDSGDGGELCFRKAVGTGDISGDYNVYDTERTVNVGALRVTTRGNGGTVSVAWWTDGAYAYAIQSSAGLESGAVAALVRATH